MSKLAVNTCACALGLLLAAAPCCLAASANDYNPYMRESLPNLRQPTAQGRQFLKSLGAHETSLENEAAHRADWKSEVYPVVFGDRTAPGEVLVLLDFSRPESEQVWKAVAGAARQMRPAAAKIVVLANSAEHFGTDLMGFGIWIAAQRPGQAVDYFSYALHRWNEVKAAQRSRSCLRKFSNEYDAVATDRDMPIHYAYMGRLKPPVPAAEELAVARYAYGAGSVNQYQATQIARYYGVEGLPAVIVNGRVLERVSADAIVQALR